MKPSKKTKILNKYRRAVERLESLKDELVELKFPNTCEIFDFPPERSGMK